MPEGFLAFILPVGGGGRPDQGLPPQGGVPTPPIYYPPVAGQGPGFPTNPIAPGGPPPQVWPQPPVGIWPNPPGMGNRPDQGLPYPPYRPDQGLPQPPQVWPQPPGQPVRPDQGLPGPQPTPTPPIFYPPEGPPQPGVPVFPSQGPGFPTPPIYMPPPESGLAPTHPIVIQPPQPGQPPQAPPGTVVVWVPGYGYILVGATPQPPIASGPRPDQELPATPPTAQPKR